MKRPTYRIEYDLVTEEHLVVLEAGEQAALMDAIPRQLAYQPSVETRNRKRMRPNPVASFELRVGQLRVLYDPGRGCPRRGGYRHTPRRRRVGGAGGASQRLRGDYRRPPTAWSRGRG